MRLARTAIFLVGLVVCSFLTAPAQAFRSGAPSGRTGSPASGGNTCKECHGSNQGAGLVEIVGAPTEYEPDTIYDLLVRVFDEDQAGAGFQISIEDAVGNHVGEIIVSDAANTQFACCDAGFVTHTLDGVANAVANWAGMGTTAEYSLQWKSPSVDAGAITFHAAGNAINNDLSNSGDRIYLTSETSTAAPPGPCMNTCGDIDGDGAVNLIDFATFATCFGRTAGASQGCPCSDLDGSAFINLLDFATFANLFGVGSTQSPPNCTP